MVLIMKSELCRIDWLGEEYRVESFEGNLCSISFKKCWVQEDDELYDIACACNEFNDEVLNLLREVVVRVKPEVVIATVVPFYRPAGPWYYYDVPPRAMWVKSDSIASLIWSPTALALALILEAISRALEAKGRSVNVNLIIKMIQTRQLVDPESLSGELKRLALEGLVEKIGDGYLILNPTPPSDMKYYCKYFMEEEG